MCYELFQNFCSSLHRAILNLRFRVTAYRTETFFCVNFGANLSPLIKADIFPTNFLFEEQQQPQQKETSFVVGLGMRNCQSVIIIINIFLYVPHVVALLKYSNELCKL